MDVPMLVSYGLSGPMGLKAGDRIRWYTSNTQGASSRNIYMGTVRSMLTKFPGYTFSGLNTIIVMNQALIGMNEYQTFVDDLFRYNATYAEILLNNTSTYQFNDNIPKQNLYIKFRDGVTKQERDFVSNGIRNYFQDETSYLLVK